MLLLDISQKILCCRRCAVLPGLSSRFLYASGFATLILARKLDSLVRVSRRVGSIHKNPGLGDAQPRNTVEPCQPSMTKHPGKTQNHNTTRKNPSRCLTHKHRINRCIHQEQDLGFPPAGYFPAPESHQSNLEQFKQTTKRYESELQQVYQIISLQP